jgi:NAD(P)H-dependent flavin oxidoreductase YrpB (nitropropane dioxygenase family)
MTAASDSSGPAFVFMLTKADQTIPEAISLLPIVREAAVKHAGAKDVGLPLPELARLFAGLREAGCRTYLEVVSATPEAMRSAALAAIEVGADVLLGGTDRPTMSAALRGTGISFFPYVGTVVGHPCMLRGAITDIADDARRAESEGADGINLLAYRYDGSPESLIETVVAAVAIPVLCAGSVDSLDRIRTIRALGAWGFTAGTAALDGAFIPGRPLVVQLSAVLGTASEVQGRRI